MSGERWIKMREPTDEERNFERTSYQLDALDAYDAAEGQRVETIDWCATHRAEAVDGYGICPEQPMDEEHPCSVQRVTLILPPEAAS